MSRWAPGSRERLETAALELFTENGFEETSVAQIAARARLNRATFFRHFADKREVLFGGEDRLADAFAAGIGAASPAASLLDCLRSALASADHLMTPEQRVKTGQRTLVLRSSTEVQERAQLKHIRLAEALREALTARGIDPLSARLGAEIGLLAFSEATSRWIAADGATFADTASAALDDLAERVASLQSERVAAP